MVLTPVVIATDGVAAYGRWSVLLSVGGYVAALDLGVGPAVARAVAIARNDDSTSGAVSTAAALLAAVGLVVSGAGVALCFAAGHDSPRTFGAELGIVLVSNGVSLPLSIAQNVLYGLDRQVARNTALAIGGAVSLVANLIVVLAGGGLLGLVIAGSATTVAMNLAIVVFTVLTTRGIRASSREISWPGTRDLIRVSSGVFALSAASQVIVSSDTLIVDAMLGPASAGIYAVAMRAIQGCTLLMNQLSDVVLPGLARGHEDGAAVRVRNQIRTATRFALCVALALVAVLVAFGEQLIHLWVGSGFSDAWLPCVLLTGALIFNGPLRFAVVWAIAADRHAELVRIVLVEAVVNLGLSIGLCELWGTTGVACASLATFAVSNGYTIPRRLFPQIGLSAWSDFAQLITQSTAIVVPVCFVIHVLLAHATLGAAVVVAGASLSGVLAFVVVAAMTMDQPGGLKSLIPGRIRHRS